MFSIFNQNLNFNKLFNNSFNLAVTESCCCQILSLSDFTVASKAFNMKTCQPVIAAGTIAGFGFDVELLLLAQRAGLRLREIPVRWNHYSGSKVRFLHDSLEMLREVVALRSRSREGQVSRSGPVL